MPAAAELRSALSHPVEASLPGWTSEFELLLACCGQAANGGGTNRIEQFLGRRCNWKRFITLAEHHRVFPQAYRALAPYSEQLPRKDFAVLRSNYEKNARQALWFTGELVRILKHLEGHGIRAIPYKGPALAQTLYGDVTARQFSDLDILVCPEDVCAAKLALASLGYKATIELTARSERAYISSGYEYSFDGMSGPHLLEVQWRILPRFYSADLDVADLFERAEHFTLGGQPLATLSVHDLLLVICVHAAKHVWAQLSWLSDVAELAKSRRIDWDATWHRTHQLGLQRIVAVNLLLAHDLLGSVLPIPIQRWLEKDQAAEILKGEVSRIIRRSSDYDIESFAYFRLMMRLRERRSDQARFLWRLIWTPSVGEWSAIHLPAPLFLLYHFMRFGRVARRIAVSVRGHNIAIPP
jgi:hypothetical protein